MADEWIRVDEGAWPARVRAEVAVLRSAKSVETNSISVETQSAPLEGIKIEFGMRVILPPSPGAAIGALEPIELRWSRVEFVGKYAPAIYSGRSDFPNDISHLNPVPGGEHVSFCISLSGNKPIYQRFGLAGLLQRLESWLSAAASNDLGFPEWHPEPPTIDAGPAGCLVFLEIGTFQDLAFALSSGSFTTGTAAHSNGNVFVLSPFQFSSDTATNHQRSTVAMKCININSKVGHASVVRCNPWLLVRPEGTYDKTLFGSIHSLSDLYSVMRGIGAENLLRGGLESLQVGGAEGRRPREHDKSILVLIAIHRPTPIMSELVGQSGNLDARHIELVGFQIVAGTDQSLSANDNRAVRANLRPVPTASRYAHLSDQHAARPVVIVGLGAVGSAIADFGLRAGWSSVVGIDPDDIESHNPPRHRATLRNWPMQKVEWLREHGNALYLGDLIHEVASTSEPIRISGHSVRLEEISRESLQSELTEEKLLIDATADSVVRDHICMVTPASRIARIEIFDGGRLGILSVVPNGGVPDLLDLYAWTCVHAIGPSGGVSTVEPIRQWLKRDRLGQGEIENFVTGFGCGSATTRMPGWIVNLHAAAAMPSIAEACAANQPEQSGGVGLNVLDEGGRPLGWQWLPAPRFVEFNVDGWRVRISEASLQKIASYRVDRLPSETGGYLFGVWSREAKRISVVAVTPEPPGTEGSQSKLNLASADRCPIVAAVRRRVAGRLSLIGTWHSHPSDSAVPSSDDISTLALAAAGDLSKGWPTLMLIQADDEERTVLLTGDL